MADYLDDRQRAMLAEMGVTVWTQAAASAPSLTTPTGNTRAGEASLSARVSKDAGISPAPPAPQAVPRSANAPVTKVTAAPLSPSPLPVDAALASLAGLNWVQLQQTAAQCQDCGLCASRVSSIWGQTPGSGEVAQTPISCQVMVITDPPDETDEATGLVLGGDQSAAGQLLKAMLTAAGWVNANQLDEVFITPVTKCKVPRAYKLTDTEIKACRRYLLQQVQLLQPRLILTLGRVAAQAMLGYQEEHHKPVALGQVRGRVHEVQGRPLVASLAPQYLLRNPLEKSKAWEDICLALKQLGSSNQ